MTIYHFSMRFIIIYCFTGLTCNNNNNDNNNNNNNNKNKNKIFLTVSMYLAHRVIGAGVSF